MKTTIAMPVRSFKSSAQLRKWLTSHPSSSGFWLRLFKKASGVTSITYAEALDQALCFGWIDGQTHKYDEKSWIQKFTPRRPKSGWSKINRKNAQRLIRSGQMKSAGLKAIAAAKKDGRWKAAYDSPSNSKVPADFLKRLSKNKKAKAFFQTLNKSNVYAITYRLQTAKKEETRSRRLEKILAMLEQGKKFHP